jgi:abhydrolase domain-containing protein 12
MFIYYKYLVHWPLSIDLSKPETVGIKGARNFYLTTNENVKIGTW